MRHVIYFNGTRQVYDGQYLCTLAVVGRRNPDHFRPQPPATGDEAARDKYRKAMANHQRESVAGRFSDTVLEWCVDRAEAEAEAAKWTAPEWLDVRIEPCQQLK